MEVSDAYKVVYCEKCGVLAIMDVAAKQITCRLCGGSEFVSLTIPYVLKLLIQLLWGCAINLRLGVKKAVA